MQCDTNVLSTEGQEKPFDYWHDVVCQTFTALSTDPFGPRPFAGQIRAERQIGSSSLSMISASAQVVRRTKSGIARRPSDSFFVNVQLEGRCGVQIGDDEVLLCPGDIIILDADIAFSMQFDRSFRQACLHLARAPHQTFGNAPMSVMRSSQIGAKRIIRELATLRHEANPEDTLESVSALLNETAANRHRHTLSLQHLALIKKHISDRSDDPKLTPTQVASHFRISKRHLHNLFARSGETFGQYLIYRRLRRAQSRIAQTPGRSLLHVASSSGFKSASHFSRSFNRQFGLSPQHWREAAR